MNFPSMATSKTCAYVHEYIIYKHIIDIVSKFIGCHVGVIAFGLPTNFSALEFQLNGKVWLTEKANPISGLIQFVKNWKRKDYIN